VADDEEVSVPRTRTSGVFKAIVQSARKLKRAVTGGDPELPEGTQKLGDQIALAFVAGELADVYALGTAEVQKREDRDAFVARWKDIVGDRELATYEVSDAGQIDLHFIPGLEDTPQDQFLAFLEIAFGTAEVPVEDERAFVLGAVLLDINGDFKLGALHRR
jgi:hypothetical protein